MGDSGFTFFTIIGIFTDTTFISNTNNREDITSITLDLLVDGLVFFLNLRFLLGGLFFRFFLVKHRFDFWNHFFNAIFNIFSNFMTEMFTSLKF